MRRPRRSADSRRTRTTSGWSVKSVCGAGAYVRSAPGHVGTRSSSSARRPSIRRRTTARSIPSTSWKTHPPIPRRARVATAASELVTSPTATVAERAISSTPRSISSVSSSASISLRVVTRRSTHGTKPCPPGTFPRIDESSTCVCAFTSPGKTTPRTRSTDGPACPCSTEVGRTDLDDSPAPIDDDRAVRDWRRVAREHVIGVEDPHGHAYVRAPFALTGGTDVVRARRGHDGSVSHS